MPCVPVQVENDRNQIGAPHDLAVDLGDVREGRRLPADREERVAQLLLRRVDLVQRLLVLRELTHQPEDDGHVIRDGGPDPGGGATTGLGGGRHTGQCTHRRTQWGP